MRGIIALVPSLCIQPSAVIVALLDLLRFVFLCLLKVWVFLLGLLTGHTEKLRIEVAHRVAAGLLMAAVAFTVPITHAFTRGV